MTAKVSITSLYKIFGPDDKAMVPLVREGMDKATLLDQHRHVLGLRDINVDMQDGEITVIMGLSGSGKSTLIRHLNRLIDPSAGEILIDGTDVMSLDAEGLRKMRQQRMSMVFQKFALLPHKTVLENAQLPLSVQGADAETQDSEARKWLARVGLDGFEGRYPAQLSGGMQQRVGIARAFAGVARIVVADEPVSALDVSVQAAVTDLLMEIQREHKTTLLFISHDLSIVRYLSDRVMVMYLGHVVELGSTGQVFSPPYHPYTEALLSAVPIADTSVEKKHIVLEGDIPSAMNPPSGCPFQTRCNWKSKVDGGLCETHVPPVRQLAEGHQITCHLSDADLADMEPVIQIAAE